jgi:demethylmenaquinone methyltransferase/2-methoxy-6-polyprenyl-1,4-benzoquinol methylase
MKTDLVAYYNQRAKEYENIYAKPERQNDLADATMILQEIFLQKNIIEMGCGTGYWTQKIAKTANRIYATDINDTVIDIAQHKEYPTNTVSFGVADFLNYEPLKTYEGLFGGFIWSHIPLQDLPPFIAAANRCVTPGGTVVFMDNNFVAGSNLPITHTDEMGNTFQTRQLADGSQHLVRKNFPSKDFILEQLQAVAEEIVFHKLEYYWIVMYRTVV